MNPNQSIYACFSVKYLPEHLRLTVLKCFITKSMFLLPLFQIASDVQSSLCRGLFYNVKKKKESECIIFSPWKLRENGNSYFGVQVLFKCQWHLQEKIVFTVVQEDQMLSEVWCIHVYVNTYTQLLYNKQQQLKFVFALVNLIIQILQMTEHFVLSY
jgi:hypothetical protein